MVPARGASECKARFMALSCNESCQCVQNLTVYSSCVLINEQMIKYWHGGRSLYSLYNSLSYLFNSLLGVIIVNQYEKT